MKLHPLVGIDDVRFGATIDECVQAYGKPPTRKLHPDAEHPSIHLYYPDADLTLGFTLEERLKFVAVAEKKERVFLWDAQPFPIINTAPDPLSAARTWIEGRGRQAAPRSDFLGDTLRVREEGVVFVFSADEPGVLEGIQLCPQPFE